MVDHLDAGGAIAHHQDVRHRRQHREDELLRLFQRGVLFFQGDFVLEQVVVDLVHLLDDFDPDLFTDAVGAGERGVVGLL